VLHCDVDQLLGSFWLFTTELVNQGATHRAILECRDDIGIGHTGKLVAFL
jgi:hypothetical protein